MTLTSILATLGLVALDTTGKPGLSHHQITLSKDGVAGEPVNTNDGTITFTDLEPGTYVASGFSVDLAGNPMTAPVSSEPMVIAPTPTSASVISSITLSMVPAAPPAGT